MPTRRRREPGRMAHATCNGASYDAAAPPQRTAPVRQARIWMNAKSVTTAAAMIVLMAGGAFAATRAVDRIPNYITSAITNPARAEKDPEIDQRRHPAELMAFAGVKPGDKVLDLIPG